MGKKYIQGKDGKFKGSVSDGRAVPQTVSVPSLPPSAAASATDAANPVSAAYERFQGVTKPSEASLEAWRYETGGAFLLVNNHVSDVSGSVTEIRDGVFEGTVDVKYLDRYATVASEEFTDPHEAETWTRTALADRTSAVYEFEQEWAHSPEAVTHATDLALKASPGWVEQVDRTFGVPTGWMRGAHRGATVQRLGPSGYLITVHDYTGPRDTEGSKYVERHLPDFDSAWGLARYLCAKR